MANREIIGQVFEETFGIAIGEMTDEAIAGIIGDAIENHQEAYGVPTEDLERPYGMPIKGLEEPYGVPIGETSKEMIDNAEVKLTGFVSQRPSMGLWLMLKSVTILADMHYPLRQPFFLVKEYLNLDFEVIHIESDHSTQLVQGNVCSSLTSKKIQDCLLTTLSRS
jgi:hypothetical protein